MAGQHRRHRHDPDMRTVDELIWRARLADTADAETVIIPRLDLLKCDPDVLTAARGRPIEWVPDPDFVARPCQHCGSGRETGFRLPGIALGPLCRHCLAPAISADRGTSPLVIEYGPAAAEVPTDAPTVEVWCDAINGPADTRWDGRERYCQHCGASASDHDPARIGGVLL